ncbi:M-phase inducer phosphatase 3 isoform X1 [Bufo bufo]|uniref:M-phase inducer phosphatase 3 isoform X1 n=1 Tax=Bufo bufo TaxID=8384 RepID=UPI001ABEA94F|nr:M-phase inducer phosphatase 3 isoform X1 [Bufo bufo]XP_040262913.1 M-phase inducer phosphatase 3 isoform X1 [Bufo bufo]
MADNHSITSDGIKSSSGLHFRTNCRMILNLLRDKDASMFSPEQPLTPITDLAVGFSTLSTLTDETPKRCLNLSDLSGDEVGLQNFASPVKMPKERGDPTNSMCSHPEDFFTPEPEIKTKKCHKKKSNSVLPRLLCSTPSFKKSSGSRNNTNNKENECGTFKNPSKPCSMLLLQGADDVQLSPTFGGKNNLSTEDDPELHVLGSPITIAPTCVDEDKEGHLDGFSEFFAMDEEEESENTSTVAANLSSSMAVLLSGPFMTQEVDVSNVSMNRSRLYRSPSMPEKLDRPLLKRTVRPQDNETPVRVKRRRSTSSPLQPEADENNQTRRWGTSLKKTLSLCDVDITKALDEDYSHRQLIGDFSKVYALPIVTGRHQDLRYITAETVAALINGKLNSLVEKFYIIDCRYPYEYEGGHIKGALNLHRPEDVLDYFLKCPLVPSVAEKRIILVFHCEFSSERGPKMCRFLREEDRARNDYPNLYYPEVYLLKGGYKEFFPEYKTLCEPQSYCPMHHQDYQQELLKCRTKSKSWAGERKRRDQIARLMKL